MATTKMPSSLEIAQQATLRSITEIAEEIGLTEDEVELYGRYKAKVDLSVLDRLRDQVVAGTEVPVEAAMGETCLAHQVRNAHALDSVATDPGGCGFHYPLVAGGFFRLRADHLSDLLTWSGKARPLTFRMTHVILQSG